MVMDFAKEDNQELVMVQLDLEKAYGNGNWSFVGDLMAHKCIQGGFYFLCHA